jgi:hypothetical protein
MKFVVTKTSLHEDERPCKEAKREKGTQLGDVRADWEHDCLYLPQEDGKRERTKPLERIRETKNGDYTWVTYRYPTWYWIIEIDTFPQLLSLVKKYGDCIISHYDHHHEGLPEIEIYDDARE